MSNLKKLSKRILFAVIGLGWLYSYSANASAPVVDESDHYANQSYQNDNQDDMQPLAHDDTQTAYFGEQHPSEAHQEKLLNEIQDLQHTVQDLKGQITTLKEQQLTLYKDLDSRINSLQTQSQKKTAIAPPKVQKTAQNPADEQIDYMAAYHLIEKKQYLQAQKAFQEFIQHYPNSGYIPNAEYWLGDLYLQQKEYTLALTHFENVINNYPASNKAAASIYKLGISLMGDGQKDIAKARFEEVLNKFPDSDVAKLAANQLKRL